MTTYKYVIIILMGWKAAAYQQQQPAQAANQRGEAELLPESRRNGQKDFPT